MGTVVGQHLLSVVVFLPLATALVLLMLGFLLSVAVAGARLPGLLWRGTALAGSTATFGLAAVGMWGRFDPENPGYQLVERIEWLPQYGIHYFAGVDGISLVLALLTAFLVPLVLLASWNEGERSGGGFAALLLCVETGMLGALVSLNLFQFYVFWELVLVPLYFLVGMWGGAGRIRAATKLLVYSMLGSGLMWVAILVLYGLNLEQGGVPNLDLVTLHGGSGLALLDTSIPGGIEVPWWQRPEWLFAAFALAFAIKVPLVPFHSWLPDAVVEAPSAGSALLTALLVKLGIYGFLRFALPLFPGVASDERVVSIALGLALTGILYASLIALVQQDVKRLVAYTSIAGLGLALLGVFALNVHGLVGSVLQLVSHGLASAALFLLVGFAIERRGTRDVEAFGGVAKPMPVFAAVFGIVLLSSIGVPALAGFVSEFLILLGIFQQRPWVGVGAALGAIVTAVCLWRMYRRLMLGPVHQPENRGLIDLDWREKTVAIALLLPILWIGIYPNPMLRRIEPSVMELLRVMDERSPAPALEPEPEVEVTQVFAP